MTETNSVEKKEVIKEVIPNQEPLKEVVKEEPKAEEKIEISEDNKPNWKKFREEREKDRQARLVAEKEAERRKQEAEALKTALEAIVNKPQTQMFDPNTQYETSDENTLEKAVERALQKHFENTQKQMAERERAELPYKLASTYPDFNKVCSSENLDYLEFHHPEVAKGLSYMPDGFEKWSTFYNCVKKFVPYENKSEDAKRLENNAKRPQAATPNMIDQKPVGSPWILTEERKKANWERMQKERKFISQ